MDVEAIQERIEELERRLRLHDDRAALRDLVAAYCRGVDRVDEATLRSLYHDDAIEDRGDGLFVGLAVDWIPWTLRLLPVFAVTQHSVQQSIFEIDREQAYGETYFRAYHRFATVRRTEAHAASGATSIVGGQVEWPEGESELLLAGRYLDRFERREGVWRIAYRKMICDWAHERPVADSWFQQNPTAYRSVADISDSRLGSTQHPLRGFTA